jgi:hypothetical protein
MEKGELNKFLIVTLAWMSKFSVSWLCTWPNLYPSRKKPLLPFRFCYKTFTQKSSKHLQCAKKSFVMNWMIDPLHRKSRSAKEHWLSVWHSLALEKFLQHPPFHDFFPRFSSINLREWLHQNPVSWLWLLFYLVTGNAVTEPGGRFRGKGCVSTVSPALCTSAQECKEALWTLSFPWFPN